VRIALEPLDVLMFRDARAFGAGADHRARTQLPPPPRTLHGALRTWLAYQSGWRPGEPLPEGLGSPEDPGELRVRGPYLGRRTHEGITTYHPAPLDRLLRGLDDGRVRLVEPVAAPEWVAMDLSGGWRPWRRAPERGAPIVGSVAVEVGELLRVLRGDTDVVSAVQEGAIGFGLAHPEPRTGVALAPARRTAQEGLLYTAEFARLAPGTVIVADVWFREGPLPGSHDVLQLGGEGRLARFEEVPDGDWEVAAAVERIVGVSRLSLYLLTPAPLPGGSVLPGLDGGEGRIAGRRARLLGSFVGRPLRLGGFDLARGGVPRPSRLAVAPGAVWRLELLDGPADEELVTALHGQSLFPAGSVEERLGFGQVLVGV
jgi:CRISPR-associated protein Cmr3